MIRGNVSVEVASAERSSNKCSWASSDTVPGIFRAAQSQLWAARPACCTQLEGQKALEEIDRLQKGTVRHLPFVFPIRGLQCCHVSRGQHYKAWKIAWLMGIYGKCKYFDCFSRLSELPFKMLGKAFRRPGSGEREIWSKAGALGRQKGVQRLPIVVQMPEEPAVATAVEYSPAGMGEGVRGITGCLQNSNTVNPSHLSPP